MNIISLPTIFILGLMTTGCSANEASSTEQLAEIHTPDQPRSPGKVIAAATDESCFHRGTIYSDGAASCQSGSQYRCSNGEWVSIGATCAQEVVTASRSCQFSDITFPTGAASCQAGTQYRCEDGSWRSLGISCSASESPIRLIPGGRTCMLEGSTVATSSTVCRSGTTFLCSNGDWVNLGTLCR